jgi:hypothetical protein
MTISPDVIQHIINGSSPHLRRDVAGISFTLVCTVEESVECRFGSGSWNDPDLLPICQRLVSDIGWKRLEWAAGRQVAIRCHARPDNPAGAACQIDLGDGWEPLPVAEG